MGTGIMLQAWRAGLSRFVYELFQNPERTTEDTFSLLGWLIPTAIEIAIISLIVAGIAAVFYGKDFWESFQGSCVVVAIIEIILFVLALFL